MVDGEDRLVRVLHADGSDLDPQELALMQRVIDAATVTYETAELGELRRRVASLERQLISALPAAPSASIEGNAF